jgi:hypothetical protein
MHTMRCFPTDACVKPLDSPDLGRAEAPGLNSRARCSIWRPLPPSDDYVAVGFLVADVYKPPDPERTNLRYD